MLHIDDRVKKINILWKLNKSPFEHQCKKKNEKKNNKYSKSKYRVHNIHEIRMWGSCFSLLTLLTCSAAIQSSSSYLCGDLYYINRSEVSLFSFCLKPRCKNDREYTYWKIPSFSYILIITFQCNDIQL